MTCRFYVVGNLTVDVIGGAVRGGGPGFYAGISISHLGLEAFLIGNMGTDYPSYARNMLKKFGVRLDLVRTTTRSTAFTIEYRRGERRLILLNRGRRIDEIPCHEPYASSFYIFSPVFREVDISLVRSVGSSGAPYTVDLQGFLRRSRRGVIVHAWEQQVSKILEGAALVHASMEEATSISKDPVDTVETILDMGAASVAVTMGERGSIVGSREGIFEVPPFKIVNGDPTGAGDVYTGVFSVFLSRGDSVVDAAAKATVAAALKIVRDKPPWFTLNEVEGLYPTVSEKVKRIC